MVKVQGNRIEFYAKNGTLTLEKGTFNIGFLRIHAPYPIFPPTKDWIYQSYGFDVPNHPKWPEKYQRCNSQIRAEQSLAPRAAKFAMQWPGDRETRAFRLFLTNTEKYQRIEFRCDCPESKVLTTFVARFQWR